MLYVLPPPAPSWPPASVARPPHPRGRKKDSGTGGSLDEEDPARNSRSLSECYFAGKGAALVLPPNHQRAPPHDNNRRPAVNGAVPVGGGGGGVVGGGGGGTGGGGVPGAGAGSDIQQHLQSMFYLLRPEETLKMAVKLESVRPDRTRYLVVVSCRGRQQAEESCLLGIDCNLRTTVGLVLRVLADTAITLDGDGGFSVSVCGRQHIFKPVSVQAMWSALQTLHKVSWKAREQNYFLGGLTHDWVNYYERRIESDQSCLNEWHTMDSIESRRPPSPDSLRTKPRQREVTEQVIRSALKEIMMTVDLDEVTSKQVRTRLEEVLDMDLVEYKPFIDQEMLVILGQMDAATEIFPHVYLGSEWNASNLEELNKNGVCHILNVTREIDNFFPGMFDYLNVRVYDDEKTDLLKHWDNTFKYITKAKKEGSKVLVHCKMGVSRSASVVIAYAMKAYNWDFKKALEYVQKKRNCIKPNTSFISQLETYQGILDAMKNKEKLQRSKSETNLKSSGNVTCANAEPGTGRSVSEGEGDGQPSSRVVDQDSTARCRRVVDPSGEEMARLGGRPKSWSPDYVTANMMFPTTPGPTSASLERLSVQPAQFHPHHHHPHHHHQQLLQQQQQQQQQQQHPHHHLHHNHNHHPQQQSTSCSTSHQHLAAASRANGGSSNSINNSNISSNATNNNSSNNSNNNSNNNGMSPSRPTEAHNYNINVRMPCGNGLAYSVSQNKILHLSPCNNQSQESMTAASVRHRISALESATAGESHTPTTPSLSRKDRTGLVLNLTSQFEELPPCSLVKKEEPWDPGESQPQPAQWLSSEAESVRPSGVVCDNSDRRTAAVVGGRKVRVGVDGDPFSNRLDRVFEREERKQTRNVPTVVAEEEPTGGGGGSVTGGDCEVSRQSSWSSYDSAVVLRDCVSRQSSWGSADTRSCTLPSRNSSFGSYDLRPSSHHDAWTAGTVKRTKQKLEEGGEAVKRVCPDTTAGRVMVCDESTRTSVKEQTNLIEFKNCCNNSRENGSNTQRSVSVDDSKLSASPPSECAFADSQKGISGVGIVKNLKKEFEAKSVALRAERGADGGHEETRVRSLPSSPVSEKSEKPSPAVSLEDLSVRKLVGKYEDRPKLSSDVERRLQPLSSQPPVPLRKSSLDVQQPQSQPPSYTAHVHPFAAVQAGFVLKNPAALLAHNLKNARPPASAASKPSPGPSPSVVVASVVAKAQSKKQQQGKTHPLARLTINKQRHNNPVYNTM